MADSKQFVNPSITQFILLALKSVSDVHKCIKRPTNVLWFYGCNLISSWSPTCFGHSCGHLQGGENKNTDIFKICLNHSRV